MEIIKTKNNYHLLSLDLNDDCMSSFEITSQRK